MKRILLLTMMLLAMVAGKTMAAEPDLVINNLDELKAFREAVNNGNDYSDKTVCLNDQIDLEGENWEAIGNTWKTFNGTFKGQGYTIKGLHINASFSEFIGFFGDIGSDGRVENLHIGLHAKGITGSTYTGGLVGYNRGTITGCSVTTAIGGSITGIKSIGGLVGSNNGNISNSYAAVPVKLSGTETRSKSIGGLTGFNGNNGNISNCYATGEVTIDSSDGSIQAGGLVGTNNGTIKNAFTTSQITVVSAGINPFIGKFIGGIDKEAESKITDCGFLHSGNIDEERLGVAGYYYDDSSILYTPDTYPETLSTNIKARVNVAPTAKDPVPTQEIIGTGTVSFTAADIADDDDWDKLKIATIPATGKLECISYEFNKNDGVVTLTGIAPGEETIEVIVIDLVGRSAYITVPIKVISEASSIYHTIALTVAEGIDCNYTTNNLTIAEEDHLFLQFSAQEYGLTADDILFLIDGEETAFTTSAFGGSYILNPISKDQTIVIALREYSVILPEIEGLTITATEKAAFGKAFTFSINSSTLDLSEMVVFANGQELKANALRADNYTYTIDKVEGPIEITVEGVSTTGNMDLAKGKIHIAMDNGQLTIDNSGQAVDIAVYSITGKSVVSLRALRGSRTFTLPAGIYIVRAGDKTMKVWIND